MNDRPAPPASAEGSANRPPAEQPARIGSAALLRGARELVIEHGGREYRLRVTQNGKLILTA